MSRTAALGGAIVLVVWTIMDPFTFHCCGGDILNRAAWWHTALGVADVALLGAFGVFAWRGQTTIAFVTLTLEALYVLASAILSLRVAGLLRFTSGYAGTEFLSLFLATIGLRIILLAGFGLSFFRRSVSA